MLFHLICKISDFDMWTSKHLAQAPCTEFTLSEECLHFQIAYVLVIFMLKCLINQRVKSISIFVLRIKCPAWKSNLERTLEPLLLRPWQYELSSFQAHIFNYWYSLITWIFQSLYFLKWCPIFDTSPIYQFSKFNNFIWVRWFLCKNLPNFVSLVLKLHNR